MSAKTNAYLTFNITVTGGTGSVKFANPISGRCHHRQITPPANSGAFSYYVENLLGIFHDVHAAQGFTDHNDEALWVNESAFYIVNAANDGVYAVTVWLG